MATRRLFCVIFLITFLITIAENQEHQALYMVNEPSGTSVLATGQWFKIRIKSEGIYRLTYDDLKNMGFINPEEVRIFGNGGTMLPLMNNEARYDDLVENTIYMNKGIDGVFNEGDFILFFGKGPVSWSYNTGTGIFEHLIHDYSNAAYYYITTDVGDGKKITNASLVIGTPATTITEFDDYNYHERNLRNFLKSGRQWFGERIDYTSFDTTFTFTGIIPSSTIKVKSNVVSRSSIAKTFTFRGQGSVIGSTSVPGVILENTTGVYANQKSVLLSFPASDDQVTLNVSYNKTESSDEGFLDYLCVNVRRQLSFTGNSLFFRDKSFIGYESIVEYSVENCNSSVEIWDITDNHSIKKIPSQLNGNILTFTDSTKVLKEYVAVNTLGGFSKPDIIDNQDNIGNIANQNLHATNACQMLIVSDPAFKGAADSLAEFHRQKDGMSVVVATTDQIYNEFSSGIPDVSAIRDFARMIYNRSTGDIDKLKYLLLVGDGSYNNVSNADGNSNFILTYQSLASLNASTSYVSDDFFGFMHENEGGSDNMEDYSLDLGVGRLPVKTSGEAMAVYYKIKGYNTETNKTDWRNNILFAGDDEEGNMHMTQANNLADWVGENYPQFAIKKVLLDAYKQVSTSTGARYPDVNRIISDNIMKGLLIFNYNGHGGENGLSTEHILMSEDLESFTNSNNLPLFVTATCEFSRFDDLVDNEGQLIENTSAGEYSLLNPAGGSIALFSTTRIVYSDQNYYLNAEFYKLVFRRDANNNFYKLGDLIKMTKDSSGTNRNKLNFILLGDPALTLATPNYSVFTDSLNGAAINDGIDTLKAFSHIRIAGHMEDIDHSPLTTFNGIIYPSVYDKSQTITTLANDGGDPMEFEIRENLIYKGKASVQNGSFSFEFIVPKDITYSFGSGKIIYYSQDTVEDGNGYFSDFIIGGTDVSAASDNTGPEISLYLNDENFGDRGITNSNPVIYAIVDDESGINTTGNGIGHDITGVIDGDITNLIVLNEYFEAELNDYTKGRLIYPMTGLDEGWHSLKLKVWDVYNNSSEETIEFNVLANNGTVINNIYNYPNPARDHTWFKFEHNRPDEELQVTVRVFNMGGQIIAVLNETITTTGFNTEPIYWDMKDAYGNYLRSGIYPYSIRITDSNGSFSENYQKLVVIRQ